MQLMLCKSKRVDGCFVCVGGGIHFVREEKSERVNVYVCGGGGVGL